MSSSLATRNFSMSTKSDTDEDLEIYFTDTTDIEEEHPR